MGRRAEVVLYRIYVVDRRHRYARMVRSGRSWAPKIQPAGEPGAYYLRYKKNGRRTFESVGDDLQAALQEQKAREKRLSAPTPITIIPARKTLRDTVSEFLAEKRDQELASHSDDVRGVVGFSGPTLRLLPATFRLCICGLAPKRTKLVSTVPLPNRVNRQYLIFIL